MSTNVHIRLRMEALEDRITPAVIINEVLADPAGSSSADQIGDANGDGFRNATNDEFIELYNDSSTTINISGWTIRDDQGIRHTFPAASMIPANSAYVVFGAGTPTGFFGGSQVATATNGTLALNNDGDIIIISDASDTTQAMYTYGSEAGDDKSITRSPDITGAFVPHPTLNSKNFSPGTKSNGSVFDGPDKTPPTIATFNPTGKSVAVDTNLTIQFSEAITIGTGNIVVYDVDKSMVLETIDVTSGQVTMPNSMTLLVNPVTDMPVATNIAIRIDVGAVKDTAATSNSFAGVNDNTTLTFMTFDPPPTVTIADDSTTNIVSTNSVIVYTLTFSEAINAGTLTIGDFSNSGSAMATINNVTTISSSIYEVRVTPTTAGTLKLQIATGAIITDANGNALVVPVTDDDTITVIVPDTTPPTVTIDDDDPDDFINVSQVVNHTLTFSEPIKNINSITATSFTNNGTATIEFLSVTSTSNNVLVVQLRATTPGTLNLQIPVGTIIQDDAGNILITPANDDTTLNVINDTPIVTQSIPDEMVLEDATLTMINLRTHFDDTESGSAGLTFTVVNSNPALLTAIVDANGILTLSYAPNEFGNATVTVTAADDLGASVTDGFLATVKPVNDTPIFTLNQTTILAPNHAGVQEFINFATNINLEPNETQTGQFTVTVDPSSGATFDQLPTIDASGTLHFALTPNTSSNATINITLVDDGGTTSGGNNTSVTKSVLIITQDITSPSVTITNNEDDDLISAGQIVTYTLNFDESIRDANQLPVLDFVNAGTAMIEVLAVQSVSNMQIEVQLRAFTLGSVILQIRQGANIQDMAGNMLVTPVTDDVTLTVVNDPPVVTQPLPDIIVLEDGPATVLDMKPFFDDTESGSAGLTFQAMSSNPSIVRVSVVANGLLTLNSLPDIFGNVTITVTATDNLGQTVADDFVVTVTPINDAPTFSLSDTVLSVPNIPGLQEFSSFITNIDLGPNEPQTGQFVVSVDASSRGNFDQLPTIDPNGTLRFRLAANSTGNAAISVTLVDDGGRENGGTETSTTLSFTLVLVTVNQAPRAVEDSYQFTGSGPFFVNATSGLLANDFDVDGPPPLFVANDGVVPTANGTVLLSSDGSFTYTPNAGFVGTDSFTYTISDGDLSSTATVRLSTMATPTVPPVAPQPPVPPAPPLVPTPPTTSPVPEIVSEKFIVLGSGIGQGGRVTLYNQTGKALLSMPIFEGFTGGVRTAMGDFNGDGIPDIVAAAGPGGGPVYSIIDGATRKVVRTDFAFEASFTGGVFVTAGDVNGDGIDDIVLSADLGGGPRVRIVDGKTNTTIADFFGIDDPDFRGGAQTALGNINGDGKLDLIVAAGFGGGPRVAVYDGAQLRNDGGPKLFGDFYVFEPTLQNGVVLASGDVDGDGFSDVIVGGAFGSGPRVQVLSGASLLAGDQPANQIANFFAGDPNNRGGVRIVAKDIDNDNRADIVTGSGFGESARANIYLGSTIAPDGAIPLARTLTPFEAGFLGGLFVG